MNSKYNNDKEIKYLELLRTRKDEGLAKAKEADSFDLVKRIKPEKFPHETGALLFGYKIVLAGNDARIPKANKIVLGIIQEHGFDVLENAERIITIKAKAFPDTLREKMKLNS